MKPTRYNWLVILIAALAVFNIALLAAILTRQKEATNQPPAPKEGQGDARAILIRELHLDSSQAHWFDTLRQAHFTQMKDLREEMRQAKDGLFDELKDPTASPEAAAQQVGVVQAKIDLATYRHFAALRALCNADQQKEFDRVIQDILRNMGGPPRQGLPQGERPRNGQQGPPDEPHGDGPPPQ
ncbi:MAG: hypothetical protein JWP88_38 [Flaviaesturariibacter sp.]|nr:hypothetical protein [Flaviaesturariibacter sp.]